MLQPIGISRTIHTTPVTGGEDTRERIHKTKYNTVNEKTTRKYFTPNISIHRIFKTRTKKDTKCSTENNTTTIIAHYTP
jgi:hypothetical protein